MRRTALSRKRSCSAVKGRFLFPEVPDSIVLGFGSVLGGADEVVIGAACCKDPICSERGDMAMPLLHRLS